jgi:hypothetical protein
MGGGRGSVVRHVDFDPWTVRTGAVAATGSGQLVEGRRWGVTELGFPGRGWRWAARAARKRQHPNVNTQTSTPKRQHHGP